MTDSGELMRRSRERERVRIVFDIFWNWLRANAPDLPAGEMVEVGLGPCGFAPFYAERFHSYIGLDVDDYRANYDDIPKVKPISYDGRDMPIADNSVCFVASHSTLEHVSDIPKLLKEIDRIVIPGGLIYLTVNPLYYSSWGSHGTLPDHATRLPPWHHLDPRSPEYLTDCPPQLRAATANGCYLNKLTMSQLLAEVGNHPWSIIRLDRAYETMRLPDFIETEKLKLSDLVTHDFKMLLTKDCKITKRGVV